MALLISSYASRSRPCVLRTPSPPRPRIVTSTLVFPSLRFGIIVMLSCTDQLFFLFLFQFCQLLLFRCFLRFFLLGFSHIFGFGHTVVLLWLSVFFVGRVYEDDFYVSR